MPPTRPTATRRLTALLLLPLLLALGGCFRMDLALQIHADESLDLTMEFADSSGIMTEQDITCADLESELALGAASADVDFTVTELEEGGNFGCRLTATGATIDDMTGEGMSVTREGETYVFTLDGSEETVGDLSGLPGGTEPEVSIAVTFPGEVIDAGGGTVDGSTVTWTGIEPLATGVTATGEAQGGVAGSPVLWIVLGIIVLLLIAAVVFILTRRKKTPEAGAGLDPQAGYNPEGGYGQEPEAADAAPAGYAGAPGEQSQEAHATSASEAAKDAYTAPAGYDPYDGGGAPPPAGYDAPVGYEQPAAQNFSAPTEADPTPTAPAEQSDLGQAPLERAEPDDDDEPHRR